MFEDLECADDIVRFVREWERKHAPHHIRTQVFRDVDAHIRYLGIVFNKITKNPIPRADLQNRARFKRQRLFELPIVADKPPLKSVLVERVVRFVYLWCCHKSSFSIARIRFLSEWCLRTYAGGGPSQKIFWRGGACFFFFFLLPLPPLPH